jgi:hypothetical protein
VVTQLSFFGRTENCFQYLPITSKRKNSTNQIQMKFICDWLKIIHYFEDSALNSERVPVDEARTRRLFFMLHSQRAATRTEVFSSTRLKK